MTSFSHSEFTDSLIAQKLTFCKVVNFVYNMAIYDTNIDPHRNLKSFVKISGHSGSLKLMM